MRTGTRIYTHARLLAIVSLSVALALCGSSARADVRLPAVFGNNMVLQQGMAVPVWGWADPQEKVTVTVADKEASAVADADGKWMVKIGPLQAGGPVEVKIAGKNALTFQNVLVGEVWVCSGQSNMGMSVNSSANAKEECAAATYPNIRLFTVPNKTADKPQADCKGSWVLCSPTTVGGFSAAAYFFGRDLHKALNTPVGLINTSWGGTPAEAWTSREALQADATLQPMLDRWEQQIKTYDPAKAEERYQEQQAKWKQQMDKIKAEEKANPGAARKTPPRAPQKPENPAASPHRPANLYNAMIAPLLPYGIAGAIWYQGESNAGRAYQYRNLFADMIRNWRKDWGQGDFPFLFVQLPNFMARKPAPADSAWAELREAQAMALQLPKVGMAITIDIGEAGNIHPKDKQNVGKRLCLVAQAVAYGKTLCYSGPTYESMKVEGNKVRIKFQHVGDGLVAKGGGTLTGFAIAAADKKFVWADAKIDGDSVVVSNDTVAAPAAVRYAWADNPDCNLSNKADLPAAPFRTDDWPGVTMNNK